MENKLVMCEYLFDLKTQTLLTHYNSLNRCTQIVHKSTACIKRTTVFASTHPSFAPQNFCKNAIKLLYLYIRFNLSMHLVSV